MFPTSVRFTGLELDPRKLVDGRLMRYRPIPVDWVRVRFQVGHHGSLERINRWIGENIHQRWYSYMVSVGFGTRVVVVAFETASDAVLFRLKGGETAWDSDQKD